MGRVTATVLFTDLVGSTELRGRLGEEAADALRRKHDQLLTQAVESHDGQVVKGLGDGILATFTGAADAVSAAVAIQQAVDRLNRSGKAAVPLAVRVGLSAGDVSFEDDDVHGTPVIEASRLCAAAAGGQILAAEMVRWLARADAADRFTPIGSLDLKGLADPVPAVRVEWEPAVLSSIPMPALLTDVGRIFVGRDAELERLGQLWKEAAAGERRVALLAGEPGVGKTRLAAEVAIRAHQEGRTVLSGRCDEDLGVPYQPFVEALRHFVDHAAPAELEKRLGRYGGELTRLVPELLQRVPDLAPPLQSDPQTERYRLFDAVAAWLSATSAEEPLLLVLDDLHWAAKPTLLLLRHIARASDPARLLILGTYRDTELTYDHPLVELTADLRRDNAVERLPLSGLDDLAVAAIVEQAAGHSLDEDGVALARAIYRETEGNPFFVREVLRHLAETKAIERERNVWRTRVPIEQLGIPEGVREVVGRRLSRLSEITTRVLRVSAVVGAEFDLAVVQAASGGNEEETILGAVEEATSARVLTETSAGRYRFSHALVRATLYEALTSARKVALHRRVAEAIEMLHSQAVDDYLPALAHHWARASAPAADSAKAIDYAVRAGNRALCQLAHDEAAAYYRQAIDLLPIRAENARQRVDLLIALGEAQRRAGYPVHRETLLEAARDATRAGYRAALARAALTNSRGFLVSVAGQIDEERIATLRMALSGAEDDTTRARLLANLAMELMYAHDFEGRDRASQEALQLARRAADPATLAHVLTGRINAITMPHTLNERLTLTAELVELADRLGDPAVSSRAWFLRYRAALEAGQTTESNRAVEAFTELATTLGEPTLRWAKSWIQTGRLLYAGQIPEAAAEANAALQLGRASGQADAAYIFNYAVFAIRYEQGRLGELEEMWREMAVEYAGVSAISPTLGMLYCELGRDDDARRLLNGLAASEYHVPSDVLWSPAVARWAAVAAHLGDREGAAALRKSLAPYEAQLVFPAGGIILGAVAHYLGLLAATLNDYRQANDYFAMAAAVHDRTGAPAWLARTRLEWARMLLVGAELRDGERARQLLGQARDTARKFGLVNVEQRAVLLLQDGS